VDWSASLGWILAASFALGALHALEPGHGKSIMGAYLVAAHGTVRHAVLLGLVVTITHTSVVFLLAFAALHFATSLAPERTTFWLGVVSGVIVVGVGIWMTLTSFNLLRGRPGAMPAGHEHPHPHPHPHHEGATHVHAHHGHSHEVRVSAGRDALSPWTLIGVGASGGLVPCPAALTALLAAVNLGRISEGIAVVGVMSLGIATTLVAIGIAFVQAGRFAARAFGEHSLVAYAPRVSAILITVLGLGLLTRALSGAGH
jgi:ABC-type nickel/cobalt efflux system permease component RcnA